MEATTLPEQATIEQLKEEILRLRAKLKRQEELYENSNLELIRNAVEIEKQSQKLAKLNKLLMKGFLDTIEIIQNIIEIKDPGSKDHLIRVSKCARYIAQSFLGKGKEVEQISIAAKIHEIGKISVPDSILKKDENQLTEKEKRILQHHPVFGAACLEDITNFREIAKIIKYQQERYDGNGYPEGLAGNNIPLGSRIIAIADYFDTVYYVKRLYTSPAFALTDVQQKLDTYFDRRLFPFLHAYVAKYLEEIKPGNDRKVTLSELQPGMILSRDLVSESNVLLLPKDTQLTNDIIEKLLKHQSIDPIRGGVFVYNKTEDE